MIFKIGSKLAFSRWLPIAAAWDLWWTKWRWGRFSPSTSVSFANLHSTNFSTITVTVTVTTWYNSPVVAAVPKVPLHTHTHTHTHTKLHFSSWFAGRSRPQYYLAIVQNSYSPIWIWCFVLFNYTLCCSWRIQRWSIMWGKRIMN
jgi:hypothetical protein